MAVFDSTAFGKRVRGLRESRKMSQQELADELEVTRQFIGRVESGMQTISIDLLVEMSVCFDVSTDFLLLGEADRNGIRQKILLIVDALISIAKSL